MSDNFSMFAQKISQDVTHMFEQWLPLEDKQENYIVNAMRYATLEGGKRFRAILCCLSVKACGGKIEDAVLLATAIEAVHSYSLIHDDLPSMDNANLRRGKPCLHHAFNEATAILAGDGLLSLAFEILSDKAVHPENLVRLELIAGLARASGVSGMVGGQAFDLVSKKSSLCLEELIRLQNLKTGALIVFSVESGALFMKVNEEKHDALISYAKNIGLVYQIMDDILDDRGHKDVLGKEAGKDERDNKMTFVSLMGVEKAYQTAQDLVVKAIGYLQPFNKEADILREIAHMMLSRER